jgi:GT2 family glycosyltransferase
VPVLTIVTPALNSAETVGQALESVRAQGLGPEEVEHLVVDGGSDDATAELAGAMPGVRVVSEPDRGLSDAMNKGVRMARGDWIGWLNADDYYLPGSLAKVTAAIAAHAEADWITGICPIVDAEGNAIRTGVTAYKRFFLRRHSFPSLLVQNYVAAPATFVRRAALIEAGGFDERFRYSMDYDLWLRLARRSAPLVIDEPLAVFRMAEGSLSMTGFERQFREHATNAREHGHGHRAAVAANAASSRAIVLAYRGMRAARRLRP